MVHDDDENGNVESSDSQKQAVSLLNEAKPLSTPFNLVILFFYNFFTSASFTAFSAIGLVNYISWGMTLVDFVNGSLIFLTVQMFTQAIVGIYGDKVVTKYGRRKPFVVAGTMIRFFTGLILAVPPLKHTSAIFGWYALFGSLYYIGYGIHSNPFSSWIIESTADEADYVKIGAIAAPLGGIIGGILAIFLSLVSPVLSALFCLIGGSLAIAATVYFLPSAVYREAPLVPKPIPSLRICIQSQEFRTILYVGILFSAGGSIYSTLGLFVLSTLFGIHRETTVLSLTIIVVIIGAIGGLILTIGLNFILAKIDKIRVLVFFLYIIIALAISTFFVALSPGGLYIYVAIHAVIGVLSLPVSVIASFLLRDLVVYDTFVTGFNRENMYLTANGIPTSILGSFIGAVPVVILTLSGFHSKSADDDNLSDMYSYDSTSLWILRISTSFVVAVLVFGAYLFIRNYPLTQKVCDQMTKVVKRREATKLAGDVELRTDASTTGPAPSATTSTSGPNSNSFASEDLEDEVVLTHEEHEDLLHMSAAELYRVHSAIDSTVYRPEQGLLLIKTFLKYGFSYACITLVIMIIALVLNTIYLGALFSTLIIYFVLLVAFYAFYEFFRYTTVRQLLNWDPKQLKKKAKKVFEEFTKKGDNLATMLAREGIDINALDQTDEDKQFLDLGVAPKSMIANDLKEEDVAEEAFVGLSGYKRIFSSLTILMILSIVVIAVSAGRA